MALGSRAAGGTTDLAALIGGDKGAWDAFVRRYAALIMAAVRAVAQDGGEAEDLTQEVFIRLCKDGFRLLKTYDPSRAGLTTWLTIVARSTARDVLRRRRIQGVNIDDVPEAALAVPAVEPVDRVSYPQELLSPRQREVLALIYEQDMDVAEIATRLRIDAQTVRSMHHKAMLKLRAHFGVGDKPD